jgi:hypothetical protein
VNQTFHPIPNRQIEATETRLGASVPSDYKRLLQLFGEFHLPGAARICIDSPARALEATRAVWCYEPKPLRVLAISPYHQTSDGNSIGFLRGRDSFQTAIYEFDHELLDQGDDPSLWTRKLGDCLADFLLEYLERDVADEGKLGW